VRAETRMGILRDRLTVDGVPHDVHRVRGGWRQIPDLRGPGRVRYDAWRDRLLIESADGGLEIRFHWRHTSFTWRHISYHIRPRFGGRVTVYRGDQPVAEGRSTWSGLSIEFFDPDLASIGGELAIGLTLREQAFATAMVAASGA
jgi:hypothetical protein